MDTNIEQIDLLRSYVLKLTDQDIYELDEISLSSAQKSRIDSWCEDNGIETPDLNNKTFWKSGLKVGSKKIKTLTSLSDSGLLIGVDIQKISEFFPGNEIFLKSNESLLGIFTNNELSYAESKTNPRETLAGIFAAKEAIFKSNNIDGENWSEIEIKHVNNIPRHKDFAISISHSADYAVASAATVVPNLPRQAFKNNDDSPKNHEPPPLSNSIFKKVTTILNFLGILGGIAFLCYFCSAYLLNISI